MIKFWSYEREYIKYKKTLLKKINKTILSGTTFFCNEISNFEKDFTKKNKSKYGIAVGSGTDALLISLKSIVEIFRLFFFKYSCAKESSIGKMPLEKFVNF